MSVLVDMSRTTRVGFREAECQSASSDRDVSRFSDLLELFLQLFPGDPSRGASSREIYPGGNPFMGQALLD